MVLGFGSHRTLEQNAEHTTRTTKTWMRKKNTFKECLSLKRTMGPITTTTKINATQ